MKKNMLVMAAAVCMTAVLCACSSGSKETTAAAADTSAEAAEDTTAAESAKEESAEAADAGEESTEAAGGTLIMVTNAEFPPYEYHENNEIVGIDVDIAKAIAEHMGMELEIQDMAFDSLIPAVDSGKADFAAAGMTVDPDRQQFVDFTDTYAEAAQVIIVKEGSEIATPDDLAGKTIGVQTGTTGDMYADDIQDAEVQRFNKGMDAVMALTQDKIDAVIIDREPAKVFVEENEGLTILVEAFTEKEYAIAVKKGNTELLNSMNEAIKELKDSGELQAIVDKYIAAE